jgi:predicted aspartyl protease
VDAGIDDRFEGRLMTSPDATASHRTARKRLWIRFSGLAMLAMLLLGASCEITTGEPTAVEGPEEGIPVEVVRGHGGTVLVYVDVYVNGQGPFPFVLDTGASRSVIDPAIADELGLPESSETGVITGVTGQTTARMVEVEDWSVGDVAIPPSTLVSLEMPQIAGPSILGGLLGNDMERIKGLLGSDALSEFGVIQIDYERSVLILRPGGNEAGDDS